MNQSSENAGRETTGKRDGAAPPQAPGADLERELYQFRPPEALTTIDETGRRIWVYTAAITGRFMRWRRALGYFVIAVFFVTPWVKIGGMQAILLQIPERRFIFFGRIFWSQDAFYLVFLLIGATLLLFFFTALVGRVWCGWLCPQTVFMEEVFRKIEEWVLGNHHEQRRLDEGPWNATKVTKKATVQGLFLLVSAVVSNTALAYFVGTDRLLVWMMGSPLEHWTAFLFMAVNMALFYFNFAWFREQFCVVLCPYARFQAVLTDADTVQVGYDVVRGEPRGKLGGTTGHCIDCHKCVAVCPTGIDIRDGYQLECVGCSRCIDACDSIMARIEKPLGLIRYDSLNRLSGATTKILRPRVLIYSLLLVGVTAALFISLGNRPLLHFTLLRPPGQPFLVLPGNVVSNQFTLSLHNNSQEEREFRLVVKGPGAMQLVMPINPLRLKSGEQHHAQAFIKIPANEVPNGSAELHFQVYSGGALLTDKHTTFLAPFWN